MQNQNILYWANSTKEKCLQRLSRLFLTTAKHQRSIN